MLSNHKQLADSIQMFYDASQRLKSLLKVEEQLEIFTGLLGRIYFLGSAIYQLGRGTRIPEIASNPFFWDVTSMTILSRSMLETAAQLNYLFFEQISSDEREYRVCYFRLRGLQIRQSAKPQTPEDLVKLQNEQAEAANLVARIVQTKHFSTFSVKLQKQLRDGRHSKEFEL